MTCALQLKIFDVYELLGYEEFFMILNKIYRKCNNFVAEYLLYIKLYLGVPIFPIKNVKLKSKEIKSKYTQFACASPNTTIEIT